MNQFKPIVLIVAVTTFSACSIIGSNANSSQIIGEWEWFRATGTWVDEVTRDSARASSHQHMFVFNSNFTFSMHKADTLQSTGEYSLNKKDGETVLRINHEDGKENLDYTVKFQGNDTLILAGKCYDCWTNYYIRNS